MELLKKGFIKNSNKMPSRISVGMGIQGELDSTDANWSRPFWSTSDTTKYLGIRGVYKYVMKITI